MLEANGSENTLGVPYLNLSARRKTHTNTEANMQSAGSFTTKCCLPFAFCLRVHSTFYVLHSGTH